MIFPNIKPEKINFDFPDLLSQEENFSTGYHKTFLPSRNGWGTDFEFVYNFLTSSEVKTIMNFYNQVKGSWLTFSLPHEIFRHPLSVRYEFELLFTNCAFRFKNSPSIKTEGLDIYSMTLNLVSEIDLEKPWIESPNADNIERINLMVQDNIPKYLDYWNTQFSEYENLRSEIETETSKETKIYFLSQSQRFLQEILKLSPNYKKTTNVLITGNSISYTGTQSWFPIDQDIFIKVLNYFNFLENHFYFLRYPSSNDPLFQGIKNIASQLTISPNLSALLTSKTDVNLGDYTPDWGGERDYIFQDIINKLTP